MASSEGFKKAGCDESLVRVDSASRRLPVVEEAVIAALFLRRFILWPCSSSEDVKPESESEAGGGVAGLFRKLNFPFAGRFLNANCGVSCAVCSSSMTVTSSISRKIFAVAV